MKIPKSENITFSYDKNNDIQNFAISEFVKYTSMMKNSENSKLNIELIKDDDNDLKFDGFKTEIKGENIKIISKENRGLLYGIYNILEKAGCDFTFPVASRQYIKTDTDEIEEGTFIENPCIEHRGICFYSTYKDTKELTLEMYDWMAKNRFNFLLTAVSRPDDTVDEYHTIKWSDLEEDLLCEVQKRGILIDISEHSTDYFFPREKLFKDHPDWFSEIDGKRQPLQICYSNKEAIDYYSDRYIEYAKEHPEVYMIGIWPLDGAGYCKCDKCRNDDLTVVRAIDYMAKKIHKVNSTVKVEHLAYKTESFAIPDWKVCDNLCGLICDKTDDIAYNWGKLLKNKGGAYYFEYNTGDNYRACANVMINPFYCRDIVNMFSNYSYKGIVSLFLPIQAWFSSSINYFYMKKAYWNATFDINDATDELCINMYGKPNAEKMSEIHKLLQENLRNPALWSKFPFRLNKQWHGTVKEKNKLLCDERKKAFNKYYDKIMLLAESVNTKLMNDIQLDNFRSILKYTKYQKMYFEIIDQYEYSEKEKYDVDGFFAKVKEFAEENTGFVPASYAKWRIDGRDSILKENDDEDNEFIAD